MTQNTLGQEEETKAEALPPRVAAFLGLLGYIVQTDLEGGLSNMPVESRVQSQLDCMGFSAELVTWSPWSTAGGNRWTERGVGQRCQCSP